MLSDEEKKAIKSFKEENSNDLSRFDDFNSYTQFKVKRDKVIIDLIEKQSKEIEEYKKQLDLDNECEIALNSKVMDLEKEIEELKEKNEYLPNWVSKKYVSKDKIKAKIEELQNKSGGNVFHIQQTINAEIRLLQSLLEKE